MKKSTVFLGLTGLTAVAVSIVKHNKNRTLTDNDKIMDTRAQSAVKDAINKSNICGKPIAKYDVNQKKAYLEYADGRKEYIE